MLANLKKCLHFFKCSKIEKLSCFQENVDKFDKLFVFLKNIYRFRKMSTILKNCSQDLENIHNIKVFFKKKGSEILKQKKGN